jgi:hypothetical protein
MQVYYPTLGEKRSSNVKAFHHHASCPRERHAPIMLDLERPSGRLRTHVAIRLV